MLDARSIVQRLIEDDPSDELHIDPTELVVDIRGHAQGSPSPNFYNGLLSRLPKSPRTRGSQQARLWQHQPDTPIYTLDQDDRHGLPYFDSTTEISRSVRDDAILVNQRKIAKATYLLLWEDQIITLRYHNTDILTVGPDNIVESYVGHDYQTKTSRRRSNDFLPCGWQIYGKGRTSPEEWYWYNSITNRGTYSSGYRIPYTSNDRIDANSGELLSADEPQPVKQHQKINQWPRM